MKLKTFIGWCNVHVFNGLIHFNCKSWRKVLQGWLDRLEQFAAPVGRLAAVLLFCQDGWSRIVGMLHIGWIPDTSYLTTEPGTETTFTMIHNASAEEMDLKPKRAKSLGAFQMCPLASLIHLPLFAPMSWLVALLLLWASAMRRGWCLSAAARRQSVPWAQHPSTAESLTFDHRVFNSSFLQLNSASYSGYPVPICLGNKLAVIHPLIKILSQAIKRSLKAAPLSVEEQPALCHLAIPFFELSAGRFIPLASPS